MKKRLNRPLTDRLIALAFPVIIAAGAVGLSLESSLSTAALLFYSSLFVAAGINAAFFLFTPVGVIDESHLFLYSEAAPVIVDLRPQCIDLALVSELLIDKKSFLPQAIFCLPHGQRIHHGFPARSEKRIKMFLEFVGGNVRHRVIE